MRDLVSDSYASLDALRAENESLRARLEEAEQTLNAIRDGSVDALMISGPKGDNVFTLEGSDHNYRLLVEAIGEGALTATFDGVILYANSKFAEMVQRPSETIVGHTIIEFVKADERFEFERFLEDDTPLPKKKEVTIATDGGALLSTQVSIGILDAEGLSGICITLTDLTETKMAAALLKANVELSRSNAELARFAFIASHDLKEPLRVVSNYIQMLQLQYGDSFDETASTYMKYIVQAVSRMYELIDDLLNYSKIGADPVEFLPVDCALLVNDVILSIQPSLAECNCEIHINRLPTLIADRAQLVQLFQNLLVNAVKYRSPNPLRIAIDARRDNHAWVLSVADNGIGIDSQFFQKIFVIFQRLHGKDKCSGTGIGLAVCKKVAERHGGSIWVESKPNVGSTFFFSIPDPDQRVGFEYNDGKSEAI